MAGIFDQAVHPQTTISFSVMPRLTDRVAVEYVWEFLAAVCIDGVLLNILDPAMGFLVGHGCFHEDSEEGSKLYILMVANPATNTLYQFIFSAPVSDWAAAWPIGETIIRSAVLDREF